MLREDLDRDRAQPHVPCASTSPSACWGALIIRAVVYPSESMIVGDYSAGKLAARFSLQAREPDSSQANRNTTLLFGC